MEDICHNFGHQHSKRLPLLRQFPTLFFFLGGRHSPLAIGVAENILTFPVASLWLESGYTTSTQLSGHTSPHLAIGGEGGMAQHTGSALTAGKQRPPASRRDNSSVIARLLCAAILVMVMAAAWSPTSLPEPETAVFPGTQ